MAVILAGACDDGRRAAGEVAAPQTIAAGNEAQLRLLQAPPEESALTCPGRPPAPPVTADELLGQWYWHAAWAYEPDGSDYYTSLGGDLLLQSDGRWTGMRHLYTGSLAIATANGPGNWSFDGTTLQLTYDDGQTDDEAYSTVRLGTHDETDDGKTYRDMSIERGYEDGSCVVYLLTGTEVP